MEWSTPNNVSTVNQSFFLNQEFVEVVDQDDLGSFEFLQSIAKTDYFNWFTFGQSHFVAEHIDNYWDQSTQWSHVSRLSVNFQLLLSQNNRLLVGKLSVCSQIHFHHKRKLHQKRFGRYCNIYYILRLDFAAIKLSVQFI